MLCISIQQIKNSVHALLLMGEVQCDSIFLSEGTMTFEHDSDEKRDVLPSFIAESAQVMCHKFLRELNMVRHIHRIRKVPIYPTNMVISNKYKSICCCYWCI